MTILDDPPRSGTDDHVDAVAGARTEASAPPEPPAPEQPADADAPEPPPPLALILRPALAAALAAASVGIATGGIFGSWEARLWGVVAAAGGAGWAVLSARSPRSSFVQAMWPVTALAASALSLTTAGASPADLGKHVGDAIEAGRLLRPPVPFDPGWRPILILVVGSLAFATASLATIGHRARLAVAVPMPLVLLILTTQPSDQQFASGVGAFVPMLAALTVLFGGDASRADQLDRQFELKRALRSVVGIVPIIALLWAVNNASFLFPEPVYDPNDQPRKPRAVPLSATQDRVLFEVSDGPFTGPWRAGVLDIYDADDSTWKLPPVQTARLEDRSNGGPLSTARADQPQVGVQITVRDLGDTAVLPTLGGATSVAVQADNLVYDPRTELLRVSSGRVPRGLTYVLDVPKYASEAQLESAPPAPDDMDTWLEVPSPPLAVQRLLATAPENPWRRLDHLRQALLKVAIAKGAGSPDEVPVERVQEILAGDHLGTPYEIVAAEALLARWAGVPSRIGFGFDRLNDEGGVLTVRPRNSAQWLEAWFDGFGWVPLVGAPQQAQTSLDNEEARFDPGVEASDEVAIKVFVPFEVRDVTQLYERVRSFLIRWSPVLVTLALLWVAWPLLAKLRRATVRRRWAAAIGPRAQIAVEYGEFRDLATDLGVADIYSTPLEYLFEVEDDPEHRAFTWLVARSLYGDLRASVTADDVRAAQDMGASLRRRLRQGQPAQIQLLGFLSKASLLQPYEPEMPNVRIPKLPRVRLPRVRLRVPQLRFGGGR